MTYSRPGTRRSNINRPGATPDVGRIIGGTPQQTARTGRLFDRTDVGIAGRVAESAAGNEAAAISNFLNQIIEPVQQIGEQIDIGRANRQVGQLISENPNLPEQFRTSPEAVQDRIRRMSGRAQDMALKSLAEGEVLAIAKSFPTAAVADTLLQQPTTEANREAQVKRLSELRGKATESLMKLPPEYVALVAPELAAVEAGVKADLDEQRLKTEARNAKTQDATVIGGRLLTASGKAIAADVIESPNSPDTLPPDGPVGNADADPNIGKTVDQIAGPNAGTPRQTKSTGAGDRLMGVQQAADEQNAILAEEIKRDLEIGRFTPAQKAQNLIQGFNQELLELLNNEEVAEARGLITLLKTMTGSKIMVGPEGKTNFWDIPIPGRNNSSKSIQDVIRTTSRLVDEMEEKEDKKKALKFLSDAMQGKNGVSIDNMEEFAAAYFAAGFEDPEVLNTLMGLANNFTARLAAPTEEQQTNLSQLLGSDAWLDANRTTRRKFLDDLLANKEISIDQYQAATAELGQQDRDSIELERDIKAAKGIVNSNGAGEKVRESLAKARKKYEKDTGVEVGKEVDEVVAKRVEARAFEATRRQVQGMLEKDPNRVLKDGELEEIYSKNLEEQTQKEIDSYGVASGLKGSSDQKTEAFLETTLQNVRENPQGVMKDKLSMFPPALIQDFIKANPKGDPKDWKQVLGYLNKRMAQSTRKDENGKPVYGATAAETAAWFRRAYKDAAKQDLEPEGALKGTGLGFLGLSDNGITESDLERLRNVRRGVEPRKGGDKGKSDDQAFDSSKFLLDSLTKIAGAVLPGGGSAANAATVENVDQGNLQALAEAWKGVKRVSLSTPATPQLSAATAAKTLPMAMTSINHPFALAIGIAEGTRTANGGLTSAYYGHSDPGNGVRNQGNFSAQQGQASPQIADRQWLGTLTKTQMTYAPVLERAGIRRGTQGYNRVMFNVLDLTVQAPAAVRDFVAKIPRMLGGGLSIESIAKARADSFYTYNGRLDAPGFGNSYSRLFQDQRSRAGVWDYRRRI